MDNQRVVFPWSIKNWAERRELITTSAPSIAAIDNLMVKTNKLRPRQVIDALNLLEETVRDRFVAEIFPFMQLLIKNCAKKFPKKYFTITGTDTLMLTREQVSIIIVCMWFNLFDYNYISSNLNNFPDPTLNKIWERPNLLALDCIINYFDVVMARHTDDYFIAGTVIIMRGACGDHNWALDTHKFSPLVIVQSSDTMPIMRATPMTEYFGGDMFAGNSAAENALLAAPECLVATLFCSKYNGIGIAPSNDYIIIVGAEVINKINGTGSSAKFIANNNQTNFGISSDETEIIVQIAHLFVCTNPQTTTQSQFITSFDGDTNKFYTAFNALRLRDNNILGAQWSYGNIYYNQHVKFIQQLLAAGACGLTLHFPSAGRDFDEMMTQFVEWLVDNDVTVSELYTRYRTAVKENANSRLGDLDIFRYIAEL